MLHFHEGFIFDTLLGERWLGTGTRAAIEAVGGYCGGYVGVAPAEVAPDGWAVKAR